MRCFYYKDPFSLKLIFFLYVNLYFITSESHTFFHNLNILKWVHRETIRINNHKANGMTHFATNHFKAMSAIFVKIHFKLSMRIYSTSSLCISQRNIEMYGDTLLEYFEVSLGLLLAPFLLLHLQTTDVDEQNRLRERSVGSKQDLSRWACIQDVCQIVHW